MTFSDEYPGEARLNAPPLSDGCPQCAFDGALAPYAMQRALRGRGVAAFYRHRGCGFQWVTNWLADPDEMGRAA